jgi:hypothetical protein
MYNLHLMIVIMYFIIIYRLYLNDEECMSLDLPALTYQHFLHTFTIHTERLTQLAIKHRQLIGCDNLAEDLNSSLYNRGLLPSSPSGTMLHICFYFQF